MLLAMVVAIMSAVVVFLQPFVIDLNDNRAWAAGGVTAEQLNDELLVVADMPNGTGLASGKQGYQEEGLTRPIRRIMDYWSRHLRD